MRHLGVLHEAGLIQRARSGREVCYQLDEVRVGEAHRRHFRSDRVFRAGGHWHFTTREKTRIGYVSSLDLFRKNVFRLKAELNTFPKFFYFYD